MIIESNKNGSIFNLMVRENIIKIIIIIFYNIKINNKKEQYEFLKLIDKNILMELGEASTYFGMDDLAIICTEYIIFLLNSSSIDEARKILF